MDFKIKNTLGEFKDMDSKQGIVSGYLSIFDNKDSDGDVIVKGAYSKTLKENSSRIAYLWQHQIDKPIGKFMELYEDSKGLAYVAKMSQSTLGKDAFTLMEEGIVKENSVGFKIVQGKKMDEFYQINEIKLYEGSAVTLAANSSAMIEGVKSEVEKQSILIEKLIALENFLKKGNASEETYRLIEFEIQSIKNIASLELEKPVEPLIIDEPMFDFEKFNNYLKN